MACGPMHSEAETECEEQGSTVPLSGFDVSSRGRAGDIDAAWSLIGNRSKTCRYIACLNPHSAHVASSDHEFTAALRSAEILIPDGIGVILAARLASVRIPERVTGFDLFEGICRRANEEGGRSFFFLGASDEVLTKIVSRLNQEFPRIRVAGTYSPPFKDAFSDEENEEMCRQINESGADLLWVGMTAPKQEKWLCEHAPELRVPLAGAIGAAFDFYAGTRRRAPQWIQKAGLEWAFRLAIEPSRMWRRYFLSSPLFMLQAGRQSLRNMLHSYLRRLSGRKHTL